MMCNRSTGQVFFISIKSLSRFMHCYIRKPFPVLGKVTAPLIFVALFVVERDIFKKYFHVSVHNSQ